VSRGSQILIAVLVVTAALALFARLRYPGKATVRLPGDNCDSSLWEHVYEKQRLQVLEPCTAVEGRVVALHGSSDGDLHLSLDPDNSSVLNLINRVHGHGYLVVEVVCVYPSGHENAKAACANYHPQITIPKAGDRVRVTGAYVTDSENGWNEVHPVTRIDVLR
jgi:hypothetical protein